MVKLTCTIYVYLNYTFNLAYIIPGVAKKRPEHLHALFSRMVKMNQLKSIYVMNKHQRICVEIFA